MMTHRHLSFCTMKINRIFLLLCAALMLASCDEDPSPVNLFISRADDYGNPVSGNQYILYHINAFSSSKTVSRIECKSFDSENGIETIFDTLVNAKHVEFDYPIFTKYYTTSEFMKVKLSFTAYASNGESTTQVTFFRVEGNVPLIPYENIIMYSACSEKTNGLSLQWVTPVIVQTADSSTIDVYDYHDPQMDSTLLSRKWRSKTGLEFVRYNDFNFHAATVKYLHDSYLAGNKYSSVNNLSVGDVILVGRGNDAIGVFQIQNIYDEEGFENDRYELTLKR